MKSSISAVIPTIEEEDLFEVILSLKKAFGEEIEIIVVDKSSDAYYNRVKSTGVKVIRQEDSGVESAVYSGLLAAHGEIIVSTDADGTHDINGAIEGVKLIQEGKADLVLGNRLADPKPGSMGTYLKFGNIALSEMYSVVYDQKIHDILTGLFVIRKKAFDRIKHIKPYRAGNVTTYAIEFARKKFKILEVPIAYYPRKHGRSKITRSKLIYGFGAGSHIIRMARDYNPLLIFGGIGIILILLGAGLGVYVVFVFIETGKFQLIGRSLIAFMLLMVGILAIIAGFILDLLLEIEKKLEEMEER